MKFKINKKAIETALWLLGELITVLRQMSKDNKGTIAEKDFDSATHSVEQARSYFRIIKKLKREEEEEKKAR